jgi:hypothetical protein
MRTIYKDPDDKLPYTMDWQDFLLEDDTIASSAWTVSGGLTKHSDSHDETTATALISGGVAGTEYTVSNKITTAAGYIAERSFILSVCQL